ncbi:hypothetical protein [Waddlia chondrophila]|uniref:Uncharacterized protein n=1 Tax=Waddlia chondrophila (strain ATCC VR-1470 / WSU 86-1044) TaxID=716544 RepID=D6YU74_WADCW|nr:hypothetical protein [Waddlia chondrophila]ADI37685.1 hypothetical protein wcw_0310 [Waddlia chondrophila WSU 86-1044]
MNIDFSYTHGASDWLHEKKANLFYSISDGYPKEQDNSYDGYKNVVGTKWTYLSGFPKGAHCALLSIAARITAVGECLIKGVGNVFGSPFSKKFSVSTGVKQLGVDLPLSIFKLIFLMPVEVIADAVISPFAVMIDKNYAEARGDFERNFFPDAWYDESSKSEFSEDEEDIDLRKSF